MLVQDLNIEIYSNSIFTPRHYEYIVFVNFYVKSYEYINTVVLNINFYLIISVTSRLDVSTHNIM